MNKESVEIKKLIRNYMEHKSLIIAFDYDDTIYPYSKDYTMEQYHERWQLLRECKELGCYMILYTCNGEDRYEDMINFMEEHDIPFDSINQNHPIFGCETGRKVFYNILLDDKAGLNEALNNLRIVLDYIRDNKEN